MVWHEPLVGHHRDPDLLVLAGAHARHATVIVEGETGGLAVWPEAIHSREVEVATPCVIHAIVGAYGVEATTVADVHDEV